MAGWDSLLHVARFPQPLQVTLEIRKQDPQNTLPNYFMGEDILTMEAEVRFGAKMEQVEKMLCTVKTVFGELTGEDPTFLAIEGYLKSRHEQHRLVMHYSSRRRKSGFMAVCKRNTYSWNPHPR